VKPNPDKPESKKKLITKARKDENTKKRQVKFRTHAAQAPALRVTQIQKPKQRIRLPLHPTASSPAHRTLRRGALQFWPMFWSLNIEI
jgi:hypothetical protein